MLLRPEQQLRRDFPHLADAARRHLEFLAERRLDGIDDDGLRLSEPVRPQRESFRPTFPHRCEGCPFSNIHAFATHFDLLRRLFAGRIEHTARNSRVATATSSISVDLPTPGSPPSSTSAPAHNTSAEHTIELRQTRWRSRATSAAEISSNGTGTGIPGWRAPSAAAASIRSSTKLFHCWHDGQRPIHFVEVWPHCWQTYCVSSVFNIVESSNSRSG